MGKKLSNALIVLGICLAPLWLTIVFLASPLHPMYRRWRLARTHKIFRNRTIKFSDVLAKGHGTLLWAAYCGKEDVHLWWYESNLIDDFVRATQESGKEPPKDEVSQRWDVAFYVSSRLVAEGPSFVWMVDQEGRTIGETIRIVDSPEVSSKFTFVDAYVEFG